MTRRNEKIDRIEKIVIYKVKSSKTALEYRLYIENLKKQEDIYFSVHYIIDQKGNILNIIPEKEISIHDEKNIHINYMTISILILENEKENFHKLSVNQLLEKLIKKYHLNFDKDVIIKDTSFM